MLPRIEYTHVFAPLPPRSGQYQAPSGRVRPDKVTLGRKLLDDPDYPGREALRGIACALIEGR